MPQMTVHGEVIRTRGNDLGVRVENEQEIRQFWLDHHVDNKLDWLGPGPPVVSIGRREDIAACKPGDYASLTFVTEDRSNGKRGTRTIEFQVRARRS
jgi:hypothetical protein